MTVRALMHGGPLDGISFAAKRLNQLQLFFDERGRLVHAYEHFGDGNYGFRPQMSADLGKQFDAVLRRFGSPEQISSMTPVHDE